MAKSVFKSLLLSGLLVAMVCSMIVPAVSALVNSGIKTGYLGSNVISYVSGNPSGDYYYNCYWYVARDKGDAESYSGALNYAKYYNGACVLSGSTNSNSWSTSAYGPYSSIGASCYSFFYDPAYGTWSLGTGQVWLT